MARRKEPGQKEYNPLDDARGRLPIDQDLIRDVVAERPLTEPAAAADMMTPAPRVTFDDPPAPAGAAPAPTVPATAMATGAIPMPAPAEPEREFRRMEPPPAPRPLPPSPPPRLGKPAIVLEKLTAQNKFLTTPREKLELDRLAAHLSGALGTSVKPSQIIRACLNLLLRSEYEIMRRAERQPPLKRPSNAEAVALAEFDQTLAEILSYAFRDSGPIKPRQ